MSDLPRARAGAKHVILSRQTWERIRTATGDIIEDPDNAGQYLVRLRVGSTGTWATWPACLEA